MKKSLFILLLLTITLNESHAQKIINGVKLPSRLGFAETIRTYVGGGVREEFFVRAYVLGLYMKEPSTDPTEIINGDTPMSVRMQMTSALLTNKLMEEKIREGFDRSLDGKTEPFAGMIDLICGVFSSEPTKVGDVYDIHYTPGVGVSASKNGKGYDFASLGKSAKTTVEKSKKLNAALKDIRFTKAGQSALPGIDFKKALFGIWFSDNPVDETLKMEVLGIED